MSQWASGLLPKRSPFDRRSRNRARPGRFPAYAAILALTCAVADAKDVDPTRLDGCRKIEDRLDRLGCFDALAADKDAAVAEAPAPPKAAVASPPSAPAYQRMTITDVRVDASELRGRKVEVTGALQQLGELVMLKDDMMSMNALFVEIAAIPRQERRRLFQLCSQGCTGIVRGRVESVMLNPGIRADRIEIP